jgi:uncharacterized repeat protein (TIGR03803 family)
MKSEFYILKKLEAIIVLFYRLFNKTLPTLILILSFSFSISPFTSFTQNLNELWGMTSNGNNAGVIFKTDGNGDNQQVMRTFVQITGRNPVSQLCEATNGKLYGMTSQGGMNDYGVLFEYDPATGIYTKKLDFEGTTNGNHPEGSLMLASNGKLYGMTLRGGTSDYGVIFEYNPATNIYTKKLDFAGSLNGSGPYGSLLQASNGKLYGVTASGGWYGDGVLFEFDLSTGICTKKLDFAATRDGSHPNGSLIQAGNGNLYGLTNQGGAFSYGVLFEFNPTIDTYTIKINFSGTSNGSNPRGSLMQTSNGKLYGMTSKGGANNLGVLFQYDPNTANYIKKLDFAGITNGSSPLGSLMQAPNGKLYGMTNTGGTSGLGVLFVYDTATNSCTKKIDFTGSKNGQNPYYGSLIQATNGKIYGMTFEGGTDNSGVLFEYEPTTDSFVKKLDFFKGSTNGYNPTGSLLKATNGKFYGMTPYGGSNNGVIFEYDPATSTYIKKLDHNQSINGSSPHGSLIQASNGKLYGMTTWGGTLSYGTLFEYDPATNTYKKKQEFAGTTDGGLPYGSLIQATNGKLYGLTSMGGENNMGVLFEYDPSNSTYTKKIDFAGASNGSYPYGSLVQASNGKLYGMTTRGGTNDFGVLFEYNPSTSSYTKKIEFAGSSTGSNPNGSLIQASNGKLYGMTAEGGTYNYGTLFEYDPATSIFLKKLDFAGTTNGSNPYGTLMQASNGKLYGMTFRGGTNNSGVLFEYNPTTTSFNKKLDFNDINGRNPYYTQLIEVCVEPKFTSSLPDTSVCPGGNTNYITKAIGNDLTYQWQVDTGTGFSNLSNNSIYSDVTNDTLHITGAISGMNGYQYRCLVSSTCPSKSIQSNTSVLTVNSVDVTVSVSNNTVTANATGATYQWIDCDNGKSPIANATNRTYTAVKTGNYAVIIKENNCTDTSVCNKITITGIDKSFQNNQFTVYPNPSNGMFTIQSTNYGCYSIINQLGEIIQSIKLNVGNNFKCNIEILGNGIYYIVGENNYQTIRQRIVVTK